MMALFRVESVQPEDRERVIRILSYKIVDKAYVAYTIQINVGEFTWTCERRYSDFAEFDRQRFASTLKQSILPPKKLVGNLDEEFVKKRREELERYLRIVFELEVWLQKNCRRVSCIPRPLARFLDFHKYEVHALVDELAEKFYEEGEKLLINGQYYRLTVLELHAITERLKLPEPTCEAGDPKLDFGHLLDFVHRLQYLKVQGSKSKVIGSSNINPQKLPFSLHAFKSLSSLWIVDCDPSMISGISSCRQTTISLTVHYTMHFPKEILLEKDGEASKDSDDAKNGPVPSNLPIWEKLKTMDFSFNQIRDLDQSMMCLSNLETLNLTCNSLTDIAYLQHLPRLTELILSNNRIETVDHWHRKLGNVKKLLLNGNRIRHVQGLSKLYSLQHLDLRDNSIAQASDIRPLGRLPCLDSLRLSGNPLETRVEYRTRVLESFADRLSELRLDDELANQRELDTVGVRVAIRKAKEDRERQLRRTSEQICRALNPDIPILSSSSNASESSVSCVLEKRLQQDRIDARTSGDEVEPRGSQ